MKIKLTGKHGNVLHEFTITEGAPDTAPEVIRYPEYGGTFVLAVRDDADGAQVYRPAKGVVEFPA